MSKVHRILKNNLPGSGIPGDFYLTDNGNFYIVGNDSSLKLMYSNIIEGAESKDSSLILKRLDGTTIEIDLSKYATKEDLSSKSNTDHNHDDVYAKKNETYNKTETDNIIDEKIKAAHNLKFWTGSKEEYEGILEKDINTIYFIKEVK